MSNGIYDYVDDVKKRLAEKDQRIAELEKQLEEKEKEVETLKAKLETAEYWNKKYDDCQQQLALTEKALKLACDNLYDINFQLYNTEMDFKEYFKQQAKEMTKSD